MSLPAWARVPLQLEEAASALGLTPAELRVLVKTHRYYEPRGARKKVFYPEHMRLLESIVRPAPATDALGVIRNHMLAWFDGETAADFERFVSQDFDGQVYFLRCNDRIKIGFTTHWARRLRVLRTACPYPVTVIAVLPGNRVFEQFLHICFSKCRRHGEWFEDGDELARLVAAIEALPK